ncbi:hypothetical protein ACFL2D_02575 [Patescibacteria group bacterium]
MKKDPQLMKDVIHIKKGHDLIDLYDIDIRRLAKVKGFNFLECHVTIYPFSRKIGADNIRMNPYEEYANDIRKERESVYDKLTSPLPKLFGMSLGIIIFLFFVIFAETIIKIETIVSVFGIYLVGKEVWNDLERFLVNTTKSWRLRFIKNYYAYELRKHTTLTNYAHFAKRRRYNRTHVLAEKMNFLKQSNSLTCRMLFRFKDLQNFSDTTAHILSTRVDKELIKEFERAGYLVGLKINFIKKIGLFQKNYEIFQSIAKNERGALDEKGDWFPDSVMYRQTYSLGRIKYFHKTGIIPQVELIKDVPKKGKSKAKRRKK